MKKIFFKFSKFRNSRNWQNSVWKTIFFQGTLYQKLFCFILSLHCLYSIPSLVWFGQLLNPLKKKIKFSKILNSRNSQNSVRKPNFFPRQALQFFFALHCHCTGDTQYWFWFDLDNSLIRWKRFFLNSQSFAIREIGKIPYEKPFFSKARSTKNFFALYSHYTVYTQYRVWFGLDNSLTRWKKN